MSELIKCKIVSLATISLKLQYINNSVYAGFYHFLSPLTRTFVISN